MAVTTASGYCGSNRGMSPTVKPNNKEIEMKITNVIQKRGPWRRFDLNVGGFTVKKCYWNSASGQILFPERYDRDGHRHRVVFVHGAHVNRLRNLLESGQLALPRDRRPCKLRVRFLGWSPHEWPERWMIFGFTVRGFTILGCRWQPASGSIQLPVTFYFDQTPGKVGYRRKQIVCAYGAHINRLRNALAERWEEVYGYSEEEVPVAVSEATALV
jgi:hypothetical protein